jgi:hypothetical protein
MSRATGPDSIAFTSTTAESLLEERWRKYEGHYREAAAFSAFVRLGEIANYLRHIEAPQPISSKWGAVIHGVSMTDHDICSVNAEAERRIGRMHRVLGVGSRFVYEELMLAITEATQLELLQQFLDARGIAHAWNAGSFDAELYEISTSIENAAAFRSAQIAAFRNWGIPLRCRWVRSE